MSAQQDLSNTEEQYRALPEKLYTHKPLDFDTEEQRFLILHPCAGDKNAEENVVRCSIEVTPLSKAEPFTAVKNSRGYRLIQEVIDVDGESLLVPVAVERFLRNFRHDHEPVRLWIRHICLVESMGEESSRYWTSPFLDRMYELSTEAVDMHIFNTTLLDMGTIQQAFDSRYIQWQKEWHGTVEITPLPKVYPVRVGQKQSLTDPVDRYQYVPLDPVTDEIRLIVLHPSEDEQARVNLHLAHSPAKSDVGYNAISYTWGERQPRADIVVTGQLFSVTKSLEELLRRVRRKQGELVMWIDAICIDQENDAERNRHLPRMAAVYDTATSVLAWLGDSDEHTSEALGFIPKLQSPMLNLNERWEWNIGQPGEYRPEDIARLCAAAYQFLTKPYFHRVWILQEIAWASSPFAVCGVHEGFSFWQMETAARNIQDLLERDPLLARQISEALPEETTAVPEELEFIRKMSYFRFMVSKGKATFSLLRDTVQGRITGDVPGYLETAIMARDFQATDAHDKIFALWNIAQDKQGLDFTMDYADSVAESYVKFTKAWCKQHMSLDMICAAEGDERSSAFYETAPSWCPDWATPSSASSMVRREKMLTRLQIASDILDGKLYWADGGLSRQDLAEPWFSFSGDELLCTGVIVDQLRGWIGADSDTVKDKFAAFFQAVRGYYETESTSPYGDALQALWAMCHGDVPSTWPVRAVEDGFHEAYINKYYKGDRKTARHIFQYVTDISADESSCVLKTVLRGRTLGFTEKGYMCLLPHWIAREGRQRASIAVLAGCSTPVLLDRSEEDGHYRFVGSVFVQGWMEGEWIVDMMGAESAASFWQSKLGEDNIIRIR
ncbi:heterokaryon incompatibility protein-domain-containing protein [Emericellopsis atlantica]|uniref:Heterokaryon incompatibility protein-domain-containing protein n=1 Tax=Emericellopsis atlantica TaxID=2614577 RepID=A0A9P7ZI11_9HYPO|nr:heterokaryon incompatibility protein-domain-containing protein [Emericellopsis atlantica]KAG9252296.1 heterokaryon incompatibility protein-domain-containing protein [Emericellopsis atlantica]